MTAPGRHESDGHPLPPRPRRLQPDDTHRHRRHPGHHPRPHLSRHRRGPQPRPPRSISRGRPAPGQARPRALRRRHRPQPRPPRHQAARAPRSPSSPTNPPSIQSAARAGVPGAHPQPPPPRARSSTSTSKASWWTSCGREHRLVVEIDSWGFHRSKRSFEDDRRRGNKLLRAGYRRRARFTDDQVDVPTRTTSPPSSASLLQRRALAAAGEIRSVIDPSPARRRTRSSPTASGAGGR